MAAIRRELTLAHLPPDEKSAADKPEPIHYPDSRVLESHLARLPIKFPPSGRIEVASMYEQNVFGVWEEWHVVYAAGQENDATNAIGQWRGKPWFGLSDKGAQGMVAQVRLAEKGREAKARKDAERKAARDAAERKRRRQRTNSDSIFRKHDEECEGK